MPAGYLLTVYLLKGNSICLFIGRTNYDSVDMFVFYSGYCNQIVFKRIIICTKKRFTNIYKYSFHKQK